MTFWVFLNTLGRTGGRSRRSRILPPEEFQGYLDRERLRADRFGHSFCVLRFSEDNGTQLPAVAAELERVLRRRLRRTDTAGRLRDGSVALLLPCTPVAGAQKLVADVRARWSAVCPFPRAEIRAYPLHECVAVPEDTAEHTGSSRGRVEPLMVQDLPLWKRTLDLVGAGLGLVLLSPLLLLIALAIKVSSPGSVLFKQLRAGRGDVPFWLYKFRTMVPDAEGQKDALTPLNESDGPAFKMRHDPRVTSVGRFLRATNLDELPQLWNVLKGDMTLVGPRPLPCDESDAVRGWQRRRLDATPGLTCIWQTQEGRHQIPFADWVRMDLEYMQRRSLGFDLWLLLRTLIGFVRGRQ
jgi:lipopolysaccharide/colanic/teichoic acid biosynthesis glycosyltransferase